MKPELMYKAIGQVNSEYIKAGIMSHQPQYNMDEMRKRDGLHSEVLEGKGIGRVFNKASKRVVNVAKKTGKKTINDLKYSVTNKNGDIHKFIKNTNDVAIPIAGDLVGTAVGTAVGSVVGNPAVGATIGSAVGERLGEYGRNKLKNKTGYGLKKNMTDVDLNKVINKYVKHQAEDLKRNVPTKKVGTVRIEGGGIKARNIIVKQIMKEKSLNLPQASKYVKDNKLF
jgi:phage tail tape-measure protein